MAGKRTLSYSALRKIFGSGVTVQNYRDKEIVFSQGEAADAVFFVESGTVKLTAACVRQKKAVIAFLRKGSFFGEGCLAGQSRRICTAKSIGPSTIARLKMGSAVRSIKRNGQFAEVFNAYLLSRIIRMEEDLIDQFFSFSERRLARVLLLLGQVMDDSKPDCNLRVSQSTLAEMVGTTRGRISKFMTGFKKQGLVRYNGSLQINNALMASFLQRQPDSVSEKE
jgi:CRP-like cAMP-binding protein